TDTVRCYLMFMGPWEHGGECDDSGIFGIHRWLNRVWGLVLGGAPTNGADPQATHQLRHVTHTTIRRVTEDMERFRFNTMLAALMEYANFLAKAKETGPVDAASAEGRSASGGAWQEAMETLLVLMAPSAPHLAEELWSRLGKPYSIHHQPWPQWDEELAREEEITLVVQVNGRVRDRLQVPADIGEERAKELALASQRVRAHIDNKALERVIYVPGKLVNVVVR
ncbi:MAG: class I tRNA ligase family protein, partial [Chloroflexota bacterium]|nr:class I tRNA ligase family protein [Chloroflexota bacterium]